ncbi:hypothetical protein MKW98_032572 [Papaver atlanticum]|uniref:YTH domain-containing family protein n=1 Tax=Papaver atlanticum TaxID=357466 RepID=A0AAD4XLS1_9MAGN|nr:hypothetical protein MKW98_032572 [Papaver atlanticum]
MATVASPADQATEILKNLTLDSQTKTVEAAPEATKKHGSVDAGDANGQIQSQERATPPIIQDFMDTSMCYVPGAYPSTAYYYSGGYENGMTGDWAEDYSRYVSQDGVEMTHGVYGDNGSLLYHHGYGYAPYGAYSPAGSPVPTMGHDGLYGPQHYQYPTPYYQSPTPPPTGSYSSNQTSAATTDVPTSVAADQTPASVEAVNGNANGVSKASAGGNNNNGAAPVKSANPNSTLNSNGSYGRGVLPGSVPTYPDPRFSYDGMRPWIDGSVFPDGQARPATSNSLSSTVSHINGLQSGRTPNLRSLPPNLMGLHSQRPATGMTTSGFMNKYYPSNRLYGQCGNGVRTGFGSNGYDSRTNGRVYYPVDNKYKPRGRGNGYYSYGNENMDGLNELNRGPRARGFKNQKGFTPVMLAVKGQVLPTSVVNEEIDASTVAPNKEEYNKEDFPEKYTDAKFFIIKSYSEDDVHKSIKYNVWASTPNGNKKLDSGYKEAQEKSGGCPVFLLFSVNTSGQFVGLAEMTGPVDFNKSVEYWQQDKWNGCFPVKWHIVKDVPNSLLKHITLENNDNKPVTNSRDTQEVKFEQGLQLIRIFKDYTSKTCILDDFGFYEGRQKTILEKRAKQQIHKQVWDSKPTTESAVVDTNEKDKEGAGANGKVSLPKPLEVSSVLVNESPVIDGEATKQPEENGSVKVSADAPKGAKQPVVATTEKRVLSNGNGVVANGC